MKINEDIMKIKLLSLISILLLSNGAQAEALLFNGVGDYDNKDNPLGVKVYRGSMAEKQHQRLMSELKIKKDQVVSTSNSRLDGDYALYNVPDVTSSLSLLNEGSFYWSMKYDETYLNTKGNWAYNDETKSLTLNTSPKPDDILFSYLNSEKLPQYKETRMLGNGDLLINVAMQKNNDVEITGPIKDIDVECHGMYGVVKTKTDEKGNAFCERVGYPITKLVLRAKDIPNITYWNNPKFTGVAWNFEFDLLTAHAEYFFQNEKFNINGNELIWNGRSLGANQQWIYKK